MKGQRIISFLPSATEMVCALGLSERLVGVTHECDYPPLVKDKPVVIRNALPIETMSQREIDVAVNERLRDGASLYTADERLIRDIEPDLILTQDLCAVCAPSGNEVTQLLKALPKKPDILWLTPKSLDGIFGNLRDLGAATGRSAEAEALIAEAKAKLARVASLTRNIVRKPRVFCMEWLDPVYCCGHWVPEMVRIAGGEDALGREGSDSVRIAWTDVVDAAPEILIVMPCGYHLRKAMAEAERLSSYPGWESLPAVRSGRVYAADANSYFARPGPRVVDGTEMLAHIIHPELFDWNGPQDAFHHIDGTDFPQATTACEA